MAQVRGITWQSDKSEFLTESDISGLTQNINFSSVIEDVHESIVSEEARGLSDEALNIDSRAPLNDLAKKLVEKMEKSQEVFEGLKKCIEGEGNTHRKDETNEYFNGSEGVRRRYNVILLKNFRDARDEYNNDRNYTKEIPGQVDQNGKPLTTTDQYDEAVIVATDDTAPEIVQIDDRSPHAAAVKDAFQTAKDFWDGYYIPAKELYDEASGLDTSIGNVSTDATSAGEDSTVATGAQIDSTTASDQATDTTSSTVSDDKTGSKKSTSGTKTTTRHNSDGTYTETTNNVQGDIVSETNLTEKGLPISMTEYKNGKEVAVYEYECEEIQPGIYRCDPSKYNLVNGERKKDILYNLENGHGTSMYVYYDQEGNRQVTMSLPDRDEIGDWVVPNLESKTTTPEKPNHSPVHNISGVTPEVK